MQRREQLLMYALCAFVVMYFGVKWLHTSFIAPIEQLRETLATVKKRIDEKTDQLILLGGQRKKLKEWNARSLPPDPSKSGQRPNALNAQRLYLEWLHDLALISGFEITTISPGRPPVASGNIYVSVGVKIEGEARYDQLCRFLDRFYRADLLHRVSSLRVTSRESDGNAPLRVTLETEGLAIVKAPENNRLFPQCVVTDDLSEEATILHVETAKGFPTTPGFLIRLRFEFMKVVAIDETTWTVERGRDDTPPAPHPAGTIAELTPVHPNYTSRTTDEFKQLYDANIFMKPAPPAQYTPKFGPLSEKTFTRGKPIEFNIILLGFDPTKGRPEFSITSPQINGMRIDKSTGKFSWAPVSEQKTGTYSVKFEAKHPSIAGGRLQSSVGIVVRDPNTPPKISFEAAPIVYLGREWKFTPQATDAESGPARLAWKLGDNPPQGMKINPTTGELTWTPDDSIEPGETTVQVTATDDGMPAQSSTLPLKLKVEDDLAKFTYLTGIFSKDDDVRAQLYDRSKGKSPVDLRVGSQFEVADVKGTVTKIEKKYLLFTEGETTRRLEVGQSLRETQLEKSQVRDAAQPATEPPPQ